MKLETRTTYRCDGCSAESVMPYGWTTTLPLVAGGMTMTVGSGINMGQDFCADCYRKMKLAVSGLRTDQ